MSKFAVICAEWWLCFFLEYPQINHPRLSCAHIICVLSIFPLFCYSIAFKSMLSIPFFGQIRVFLGPGSISSAYAYAYSIPHFSLHKMRVFTQNSFFRRILIGFSQNFWNIGKETFYLHSLIIWTIMNIWFVENWNMIFFKTWLDYRKCCQMKFSNQKPIKIHLLR